MNKIDYKLFIPYKSLFNLLIFLFLSTEANAQNMLPIIPAPQNVTISDGRFYFKGPVKLQGDSTVVFLQSFLSNELAERFHIQAVSQGNYQRSIVIHLDNNIFGAEAYHLDINSHKIIISGKTPHGIFNGIQSLIQLIYNGFSEKNSVFIPACKIEDSPRFEWRGFMVDESRHFFGKQKIKELLDLMALHKLNIFHWHLTDEPGWRIQINGYPNLTRVGGRGNWSNPDAAAQYYTQQDIREIVAYAKKRFIKIIPEIDMPGHASAANLAYPEFSGGGSDEHPDFTFNPGQRSTYQYLTNILREVIGLFPSKYVHIGGDEVHFGNQKWKEDPDVRQLMMKQGLKNIKEVESYFIGRMADSVRALGDNTVGWDEVAGAEIPKQGNVIMWWRHDKPEILDSLLREGYRTILCPRIPMYFDFVQYDTHQWGRRWDGFADLKSVYEFPSRLKVNVSDNPHILGIQANLWTETIDTEKRFDFMVWPRLSAMAEAAWTLPENKSYTAFRERLNSIFNILDQYDIYYFDVLNPSANPEPAGVKRAHWQKNHR